MFFFFSNLSRSIWVAFNYKFHSTINKHHPFICSMWFRLFVKRNVKSKSTDEYIKWMLNLIALCIMHDSWIFRMGGQSVWRMQSAFYSWILNIWIDDSICYTFYSLHFIGNISRTSVYDSNRIEAPNIMYHVDLMWKW